MNQDQLDKAVSVIKFVLTGIRDNCDCSNGAGGEDREVCDLCREQVDDDCCKYESAMPEFELNYDR